VMGVLGWVWRDVAHLTYRQLLQAHDAKLVNQWDQTASLAALLDGLIATTVNAWGKRKIKPRGFYTFHPYRKKVHQGLRINSENIGVLKQLGDIVFGGKKRRK